MTERRLRVKSIVNNPNSSKGVASSGKRKNRLEIEILLEVDKYFGYINSFEVFPD